MANYLESHPLFKGLNPEQANAIASKGGALLVIAAPGSGKTTVLTRRIAHLVENKVPAANITAVTFSKAAAIEMKSRISAILGTPSISENLTIATFNSFGLRIVHGNFRKLGYPTEKPRQEFFRLRHLIDRPPFQATPMAEVLVA